MTDHHDVIIIGSGAGGGTMFQALGATGKRVLLLERGDFLTREKQNWSPVAVWGEHRYRNAGPYLDRDGQPLAPKQHFYVGGNTKVYGAVLFRMRERDFGVIEHHGGTSPEWPLTYDDFELPNRSTCACRRSGPRRHPDAIAASKSLASTPPSAHSVRQGVNCCKQRRGGSKSLGGVMAGVVKKSFGSPDERRTPDKTVVEVVDLGSVKAAKVTLQPGWRWSECIKPVAGTESCQIHHEGMVAAGHMHVRHNDGTEIEIGPGDAYVIEPGHDAWVVGSEVLVGYEFDSKAAETFARS